MAVLPVPGDSWIGLGLEEQIGDGTSVRVFAAFDPELDRRVAVKVLDPDGIPTEWAERFVRDAQIAGSLDHPRIIPILRAGIHRDVPYVVMPFIEQGDLRDALTRGPLSIDDTTNVIGRIGSALDRIHAAGLVHRNVRPANILRTDHADKVYLTGLGMVGRPLEHPHHASPELIRGESVTTATDRYSLGAILFECLTGRVPYPAGTTTEVLDAHQTQDPPAVSALRPDLPAALDEVVAIAMAKDPDARYRSGQAMVDAIMAARASAQPGASPRLPAPPPVAHPTAGPSPTDDIDADATAAVPVVGVIPTSIALDTDAESAAVSDAMTPDQDGEAAPEPTRAEPAAPVETIAQPGWASGMSRDPSPEPTRPIRTVDADHRLPDGSVDGEDFGLYEDDESSDRLAWVVGIALVVAAVIVGLLGYRAVNTDADLVIDPSRTTITTPIGGETGNDAPDTTGTVDPEG